MLKYFGIPFANAGGKTPVPAADPGTGAVSYATGWGPYYQLSVADPNSLNIDRQQTNQMFYDVTAELKLLQEHGVPDFITSALNGGVPYSYGIGDVCRYESGGVFRVYMSRVAANVDLPTVAASWAVLRTGGDYASLSASVAANALTVTVNPETLDFRSTVLTSGVPVARTAYASGTLVVPNGATLGMVDTVAARLVVGWIDNAGALEPFICQLGAGVNLDESGVVTTVALSAGSDSAGVVYTTAARVSVAYRVRGYIDISEAVAGVWATGPTLVQPCGGATLSALSSFGYGQSWTPVTRVTGVDYYNPTGKPIALAYSYIVYNAQLVTLAVDLVSIDSLGNDSVTSGMTGSLKGFVPVGGRWSLSGTFNSVVTQREFR